MSSQIGIVSSFGPTCPSGCLFNELSQEQSKTVKTIRNASGVTVQVGVLPMITTKITQKGKGIPSFSIVAATSSFSSGTAVVTGLTVEESNDDFPDFTIEAEAYTT